MNSKSAELLIGFLCVSFSGSAAKLISNRLSLREMLGVRAPHKGRCA